MIEKRVVTRYVRALLDVAVRQAVLDQVEQELVQAQSIIRDNADLREVLLHPRISRTHKKKLMEAVLKPIVSTLVFRFFCHIIDKRREELLVVIGDEFKEAADAERGIVKVAVQTAVDLSEEKRSTLRERLEQLLYKRVDLTIRVSPEILGGIIFRSGSQIVDGSIKGRLDRLKDRLLELKVA